MYSLAGSVNLGRGTDATRNKLDQTGARELIVRATLNVPYYYKDDVAWLLIFMACQKQQCMMGITACSKP